MTKLADYTLQKCFLVPENAQKVKQIYKDLDRKIKRDPAVHLAYQILRGRDWRPSFLPPKPENGKVWAVAKLMSSNLPTNSLPTKILAGFEPWKELLVENFGEILAPSLPNYDLLLKNAKIEPYNDYYIYILARTDLDPAYLAVQAAHAAFEMGGIVGSKIYPKLVLLAVYGEDMLVSWYDFLNEHNVQSTLFWEPDINAHTALCTEPIQGFNRQLFWSLDLVR